MYGSIRTAVVGPAEPMTSPGFPGMKGAGKSFALNEEWYAQKNFASDLHVILVQETAGMRGRDYGRPPFPATWVRQYGQGRVFYTSFGHRDDIWTNPTVQQIILGGFAWAMGNVDADITRLLHFMDEGREDDIGRQET